MNARVVFDRRSGPIKWAILAAAIGATGLFLLNRQPHTVGLQHDTSGPSPYDRLPKGDFSRAAEGTVPDGQFAAKGGDLALSPELIKRFEYYLSGVGERGLDQIRAAITKDLQSTLNERGLKEALRILDQYWKFKTALATLPSQHAGDGSAAALAANFQAIRNLRAEYFMPAEVKALFAQTDEYDDYMVRKMTVLQDKSLSDEQRKAQLARLVGTLNPSAQADVQQPVIHLTLAEKVEQARQSGASDADIHQIRTEMVGPEATRRLEALDNEQAQWTDKINRYKAALEKDPAGAEQLKQQLFTPREQLRLAAYL